jgi:hypothetical protein
MSVELRERLERLGRQLDDAIDPVTADEITAPSQVRSGVPCSAVEAAASLGEQRPPSRRWPVRIAAAAAVVAAIVGGVVLQTSRQDPKRSKGPDSAAATPPASASQIDPPLGASAVELPTTAPSVLGAVAAPFVPSGFTVVNAVSDYVVAYDTDGVRLEVRVGLDQAESVLHESDGQWHAVPQGQASPDGSMIVTATGDYVSATFFYGGDNEDLGFVQVRQQSAASIAAGVADALSPALRRQIIDDPPALIDSADLRASLRAALQENIPRGSGYGERLVAGGDFAVQFDWGNPDDPDVLALEAVHSVGARLPDGLVYPDAQTVTATRWINQWQLILTARAPAGAPSFSDADMERVVTDLAELFADWSPSPTPELSACDTRVVQKGDSPENIAERFGLDLSALETVNSDLEANFHAGARVNIPCGARPALVSADTSGLDQITSQPSRIGFVATTSLITATDRWAYIVSAGGTGNTGQIRVERFDRRTGAALGETVADIPDCHGPAELDTTTITDLEAVPFRCTAPSRASTIDIFSLQTAAAG